MNKERWNEEEFADFLRRYEDPALTEEATCRQMLRDVPPGSRSGIHARLEVELSGLINDLSPKASEVRPGEPLPAQRLDFNRTALAEIHWKKRDWMREELRWS